MKLLESFHCGKEFFVCCGVILLGAVHLSRIEIDWLYLLGYDYAKLEFRSISMYFK